VFGKLVSFATSGITNLISKYAIRASVLIPFLFAFAFGLAALTIVLIDTFGYRDAYLLLAAGFGAIGVIALIAVWLKERNEEQDAVGVDAGSVAAIAGTAVETGKQMPAALVSGASDAAFSFRGLANLAARNWPLVIAASIAAIILGGLAPEHHRYDRRYRSRY
jgi:hypothetical protein